MSGDGVFFFILNEIESKKNIREILGNSTTSKIVWPHCVPV